MIAMLTGQVAAIGLEQVVLDVGGVGFAVRATPATLATLVIRQQAVLHTSMVVREDSLTLYGFADAQAKELFELVQTASGIGPRIALAMLAVLEPEQLRAAIAGADTATLTRVPGIGKKGAERLVLELRDKVGVVAASQEPAPNLLWREQLAEALVGLGFTVKQAAEVMEQVATDLPDGPVEVSDLLRRALAMLGRTR